MKTKLLIGLMPIMALILSCSSGSDNSNSNSESTNEEMIIGKWKVEYQWEGVPKENYDDYLDLPVTDMDNTTDYTVLNEETTFLFRTDGTVQVNEWGEVYEKEYYFEGNNLYFSPWDTNDIWLYWKIFVFTDNNLIARKSCYNNECDSDWIEVRYYKKL